MAAADPLPPDLDYAVEGSDRSLTIVRQDQVPLQAESAGDLVFLLEKDITVELQKRRSDHFFLHSAALAWRGRACLLAADTGSGKSFTTWALLHHGFEYLSDELSPIQLDSMQVAPYPHALCLKQPPPADYPLPNDAIRLRRTMHIPSHSLPGKTVTRALPLGFVFLLSHRPDLAAPDMRAIGPAEAAARLYVTALNPLSHPNRGLDAVLRIAEHVPCFTTTSADLTRTCAMIRATVEDA